MKLKEWYKWFKVNAYALHKLDEDFPEESRMFAKIDMQHVKQHTDLISKYIGKCFRLNDCSYMKVLDIVYDTSRDLLKTGLNGEHNAVYAKVLLVSNKSIDYDNHMHACQLATALDKAVSIGETKFRQIYDKVSANLSDCLDHQPTDKTNIMRYINNNIELTKRFNDHLAKLNELD